MNAAGNYSSSRRTPIGFIALTVVKHSRPLFPANDLKRQLPAESNWPLRSKAIKLRLIQRAKRDAIHRQMQKNQGVNRTLVKGIADLGAACRLAALSCCNILQKRKASSPRLSMGLMFIGVLIPLWERQTEHAKESAPRLFWGRTGQAGLCLRISRLER